MMKTTRPRNERLAEMLNDASIDRLMAIDTDWKIIAWNRMSELISGISKKEVIGKPLLEVFPELQKDEEIIKCYRFALEGKKSYLESRAGFFNRDHYENHFIPLTEENGAVTGVMNIMHDVAHRIKAEQELQKLNEALKEKYLQLEKASGELATFTALTGTELKEPIRNVYTALEYLVTREGQNFSHNGRANLRRIQASLNRMNLLLDDILTMSSSNSFSQQFSRINLEELTQEVLTAMKEKVKEKQVLIETVTLPDVYGSRQMLHYLFLNIIDIAIKFHDAAIATHITITSGRASVKDRSQSEATVKEYTCIAFTDSTAGFDSIGKEKMFTTLERSHSGKQHSSAGFTLTMCRKIAEAHGGFIEAEGQPGKGASFYCYIEAAGQ